MHEKQIDPYQAALDTGLTGVRRRRAIIQMASSLRNLGDAKQAAELLTAELGESSDELDGAVRAFLALALVDLDREREAVALSLTALSHYCRATTDLLPVMPKISGSRPGKPGVPMPWPAHGPD